MLGLREGFRDDAQAPDDVPALFPYQEEGAQWLSRRRYGLLADDMGLGKTAQAIRAADLIHATRILVLCPAIARPVWMSEFSTFSTRGAGSFTAVQSSTSAPPTTPGIICSYDLMTREPFATWLQSQRWELVVCDESHFLNGVRDDEASQRSKAVYGKLGVVHRTQRLWALSGTPARNHAGELWPLLFVCGVSRLSRDAFIDHFCQTIRTPYEDRKVVGNRNEAEFRALIKPFMLRRKKEDVLKDLPPILYVDHPVEAAPVDMQRWYHEVMMNWTKPAVVQEKINAELFNLKRALDIVGIGEPAADALKGLGDRCELSRRYVGLSKVPPVVEIVTSELENNAYEKIVLFGWHKDVLKFLQENFRKYRASILWGNTPPGKRAKYVKEFQTDPRCRVIVCNIQAAGTAITLTAASEVGVVESSYVPSDMAQAVMRVHRIGQTKPVRVRFFNAAETVDEQIQRIIRRKTRDLIAVFDRPAGGEAPGGKVLINPFEE